MMEDARSGCFAKIITKEVSRFSRNLLDTISLTRELKALGVEVEFLADGIRSMDTDAELRLSIMASIAQEESRRTSQRVTWGQTRQMERGVVFGHSLLGYTVNNGTLSIEPIGAALVSRIFEMYSVGQMNCREIAEELGSEGGRRWNSSSVLKILKNEKYVGDLVQRKSCTPDYLSHKKQRNRGAMPLIVIREHHEGIISRELWDMTRQRLEKRRKTGAAVSGAHALSGKIHCGECGSVFVSRQKNGRRYWRCRCGAVRMLRDDDALGMLEEALGCLRLYASPMDLKSNARCSELLVRTILERITVYGDRRMELRLSNLPLIFTFGSK